MSVITFPEIGCGRLFQLLQRFDGPADLLAVLYPLSFSSRVTYHRAVITHYIAGRHIPVGFIRDEVLGLKEGRFR